jgi:hypothetical protein
MTFSLLGGRGLGDFRHFWRLGSLCGHTPRPQAVLDIFFCQDLYSLTMVGWEKRSESAPSAGSAEKQFFLGLSDRRLATACILHPRGPCRPCPWLASFDCFKLNLTSNAAPIFNSLRFISPYDCSIMIAGQRNTPVNRLDMKQI